MIESLEEAVDATKNLVCGSIFASKVPPSFDDSLVIAVDLKVSANKSRPRDRFDEKLETDSFRPSDVSCSVQSLPSRDESPGSPSVLDGDGNPETRACI
jgi:hypothetical protein